MGCRVERNLGGGYFWDGRCGALRGEWLGRRESGGWGEIVEGEWGYWKLALGMGVGGGDFLAARKRGFLTV